MKKILPIIIVVFVIAGFGVAWKLTKKEAPLITNFEECVRAGNPVMESYPRQCRHQDKTFVEDIGNEREKADLIRLFAPRPNQVITSPLTIKGEARGTWFFEASFPVVLTDWDGRIIAQGIATAKSDPDATDGAGWMTSEFVPFEAMLTFAVDKNAYSNRGALILRKDNPSGLPEHDDALEIPVVLSGDAGSSKACTQEAKLCPDGSAVGRTGPNCEFAACPSGNDSSIVTAQIGKSVSALGVTITPEAVLEDSRCPTNVTCIWAGRVRIRTILKSGMGEASQIFTLGEPITTEAEEVTLTGVEPASVAGVPIAPKDYRFTFMVGKRGAPGTGTVQGKVTVGPTCPVERIPPDPQCADKPYQGIIEVRISGKTKIVATTQSDSKGAFQIGLSPGEYDLNAKSGAVFPSCSARTVTVESGKTVTLNLSCDSGIR